MRERGSSLSEKAYVAFKEDQAMHKKLTGGDGPDGAQDDLGQDAAEANLRTNGATHVDTSNIGGTGAPVTSTAGAGTSSLTSELYQFFIPVISSLQTVYVWMSSLSIPGDYGNIFGEFFSATAIDIAQVVQAVAAYATPLMQLLAGLIVVGGLYYLCAVDNRMFQWYLARYTLKRDQLERKDDKKEKKTNVDLLTSASGLQVPPPQQEDKPDRGIVMEEAPVAPQNALVVPSQQPDAATTRPSRFSIIQRPFRYAHSLVSSAFLTNYPDPFDDTVSSDLNYSVAIMPLTQCQKIDRFCKEDDLPAFLTTDVADVIEVVDDDGVVISLSRDAVEGSVPYKEAHDYSDVQGIEYVVADPDAKKDAVAILPPQLSSEHNPASDIHVRLVDVGPENRENPSGVVLTSHLEVLGCYCRRHPYQRLSPLLQTIIWPFEDPPTCCVVSNGMRCDQRSGVMFRCGHHGKTVDDAPYSCDYAICQRHYRGKLKDVLLAQLVAIRQLIRDRGWSWALAVVFVTLGNAAYTPFMKTALMIISCNSYFQCVFSCWDAPDATFVVAAFLCIVMLVAFGLGIPAIQVSLLRFRMKQLETIFLSAEYGGRYAAVEEPTPRIERMGFGELVFGIFTGSSIVPIFDYFQRQAKMTADALLDPDAGDDEEHEGSRRKPEELGRIDSNGKSSEIRSPVKGNMLPSAGDASATDNAMTTTATPEGVVEKEPTVSVSEWSRFLATDPTAMAMLYNTMELKFMHLSPILLLWKVIMISQVVFLEQGSLGQIRGMAIVEILFAALIFLTAPFTSPVVDAMYRLASIHQLLLLGLQNLDTVRLIDGQSSIGVVMIAISMLYLAICVVVIGITMVWPAVMSVRDKQQSEELLRSLGFQFSGTTTLYVTPVVGKGVMVEEREAFRSAKGKIVKVAPHNDAIHPADGEVLQVEDSGNEHELGGDAPPAEQAPLPIGAVIGGDM
ncbi:transmembrane protein, putative [Bodo saltans]|uniref:Transmembrane protein, putative n=1 Tax=Bodo saltans TaxID=75058 RepID=A0A0S4IQR7_BODSA|nr:transmembrane protein, putative [Bodo saltans]|eukprot:CUF33150.1 transmembrane protein, putative [Bodo saltans]